jgi:hypothetical protein
MIAIVVVLARTMQEYLGRENIAILEEQLTAFKVSVDHWKGAGGSQQ